VTTTTTPTEADDADDAAPAPVTWRLPWVRTMVLIVVLCFAAGVVGWIIGQPSDPTSNDVDVGFLADMSEHHQGAINLAFEYLPHAEDPTLAGMAREIVVDQSQEIGFMNGLLGDVDDTSTVGDGVSMDWMGESVPTSEMPGLASKADFDRLATESGITADDDFSRLMIEHHAAGVAMAEYAAEHGENETVRTLARKMAKAQRFEIGEMNLRRVALGLGKVDASTSHSSGSSGGGH
jgi:uncharacterized protein (DUF305 family)